MLVYVATVAISAFFVPHYLSVFWEPLRENPWDIVGGDRDRDPRRRQHRRRPGGGEPEHRARRRRLRHAAPARRRSASSSSSARRCSRQRPLGVAPTWGDSSSRSRWRCWPTRGSRPSPTSPRRCATRSGTSRSVQARGRAVFAIYFTLPLIALSALPVYREPDGDYVTLLGLPPEEGGSRRPCARRRAEPRARWPAADGLEIYVGILAATILFIAANAGVIGASRITYAMAGTGTPDRVPEAAPAVQDTVARARDLRGPLPGPGDPVPGRTSFLGRSTPSARLSRSRSRTLPHLIRRRKRARRCCSSRARTSAGVGSTGPCSHSSAGSGPASPGSSSSSRTRGRAGPASAGSPRLRRLRVYRRRFVRLP